MQSKNRIRQVLLPEMEFWRNLIKFAIPIALQNLTTALFGIIDVSIISNMGEVAVSSVSIANQVSYISNNITFGITSGASVILSRCYGAKDKEGMDRAVCDHIAGMTDHYAVALYKEIFIPKGWVR